MSRDITETERFWLTVEQVADEVQVGVKSVYRAIANGRLRAARLNSRRGPIRVHRDWIREWMKASATPVEVAGRR